MVKKKTEDTAAEAMDLRKPAADAGRNELSIEESFKRLEEILERMEDEDIGLEESFKLYEEGLLLAKNVNAGIDRVEKRMEILGGGEKL